MQFVEGARGLRRVDGSGSTAQNTHARSGVVVLGLPKDTALLRFFIVVS